VVGYLLSHMHRQNKVGYPLLVMCMHCYVAANPVRALQVFVHAARVRDCIFAPLVC